MTHAVVIVSGGDAVSPYTTPTTACVRGLAAGNTDTYIRERLLAAGMSPFTAPAMNARSVVEDPDPDSFGAFGGQPEILPASMTMVSNGDIDNAGEHLARFIDHLHRNLGVRSVSWVGHSNGGLFATAATRILKETGHPIRFGRMVTLGTPWTGTLPLRVAYGEVPREALLGDERALAIVADLAAHADAGGDLGLARQDTHRYLLGQGGWLAAQAGALDDIPVLLVGGRALQHEGGDPALWPFDGLVSEHSGLARDVPDAVIPERRELAVPLYHSIFLAERFGEPWSRGMTWNADCLDHVVAHLAGA